MKMIAPKWLGRETVRAPYLFLALTEADYFKAVKHCGIKDPSPWLTATQAACVHTWESDGKTCCVVCLRVDAYDSIGIACTLVHEAVHVFQRLCDSIGESEPSREFEAYSIERISEELMREYVRRGAPA